MAESLQTRDQVLDQIVCEQFLKTLPDDVRVFVRERGPRTSTEGAKLTDDYFQARGRITAARSPVGNVTSQEDVVTVVGRWGTRQRIAKLHHLRGRTKQQIDPLGRRVVVRRRCYNCHKKSYYSSICSRNAMLCSERRVACGVISSVEKKQLATQHGVLRAGLVEGMFVKDILLDTGCLRTLVHQSLVPGSKLKERSVVAIRCAHGDTVLYPLADITMEVNGEQISVEAGVSETLHCLELKP